MGVASFILVWKFHGGFVSVPVAVRERASTF